MSFSDLTGNEDSDPPGPDPQQPAAQQPGPQPGQQPGAQQPAAQQPAAQQPVAHQPGAQQPTAQQPVQSAEPMPTPGPAGAPTKRTYPIRGVLWGIMFGLGLTVVTILTKIIPLSLIPAIIVLLLGIAIGVGWSLFGPPKPPR